MTREQRVLDYLERNGTITSIEAFERLGVSRLSAAIFVLKKRGYNIGKTMVKVKNRYGDDCYVARYFLKKLF